MGIKQILPRKTRESVEAVGRHKHDVLRILVMMAVPLIMAANGSRGGCGEDYGKN